MGAVVRSRGGGDGYKRQVLVDLGGFLGASWGLLGARHA